MQEVIHQVFVNIDDAIARCFTSSVLASVESEDDDDTCLFNNTSNERGRKRTINVEHFLFLSVSFSLDNTIRNAEHQES